MTDIRQLRLFCLIVERGSFSQAAADLGISQPAASQQVRALERELDTVLLDRSSRVIAPTDAGRVLFRHAREIVEHHDRARMEMSDLRELLSGAIVLGASSGPGEHVLPGLLARFKRQHPGVGLTLHIDDTHAVAERVAAREFEIGAIGAPVQRPDLILEPLACDKIVLACGPGHRWFGRHDISLDELMSEPHIVQQRGAGLRSVVEERLRLAGARPEDLPVTMEIGLMESAKQAAIAGAGVTFLSHWAVAGEVKQGRLCTIDVAGLDLTRELYTVRSRVRVLSRAATVLLEFFQTEREQGRL